MTISQGHLFYDVSSSFLLDFVIFLKPCEAPFVIMFEKKTFPEIDRKKESFM